VITSAVSLWTHTFKGIKVLLEPWRWHGYSPRTNVFAHQRFRLSWLPLRGSVTETATNWLNERLTAAAVAEKSLTRLGQVFHFSLYRFLYISFNSNFAAKIVVTHSVCYTRYLYVCLSWCLRVNVESVFYKTRPVYSRVQTLSVRKSKFCCSLSIPVRRNLNQFLQPDWICIQIQLKLKSVRWPMCLLLHWPC